MLNVPEEVKELFNSDSTYKNFRVHFPNGERADITNENIVSESVKFTESICSQDTLKFGLCESPSIEFETVGVENIKGMEIECGIEVDATDYTHVETVFNHKYVNWESMSSADIEVTYDTESFTISFPIVDCRRMDNIIYDGEEVGGIKLRYSGNIFNNYYIHLSGIKIKTICEKDGEIKAYDYLDGAEIDEEQYESIFADDGYIEIFANSFDEWFDENAKVIRIDIEHLVSSVSEERTYSESVEFSYWKSNEAIEVIPNGVIQNEQGRWMYNLPYGLFTISECKRQTNLEHRKVVAYGNVAYADWKLTDSNRWQLSNAYAYTNANLPSNIALSNILSALLPSRITQAEEVQDTDMEISLTSPNEYPYYSLKIDNICGFNSIYAPTQNEIRTVRMRYENEYINKVNELNDIIKQLGIRVIDYFNIPTEALRYVPPSHLIKNIANCFYNENYAHYSRNLSANCMGIDLLKPQSRTYTEILFQLRTSGSTYGGSTLFSEATYIPRNMKLCKKNSVDDETEVLYDTGTYNNLFYASSIPFSTDTDYATTMKKKSKTVRLYLEESSSSIYVDKTMYYYDVSDLFKRDFQKEMNGLLELNAELGKFDRYGTFNTIKVDVNLGLFPKNNLYPSSDLFPKESNVGFLTQSQYETAWYDDDYTKPYGRVEMTYLNSSSSNAETVLYSNLVDDYEDNTDKYAIYELKENYVLKNYPITPSKANTILSSFCDAIRDVRYMPSDVKMRGLPYIEVGDALNVITNTDGFETLVLERTLSGIQALTDAIRARGE